MANYVLSSDILSAASAQMTLGKSAGFTSAQLYEFRMDADADKDSVKIRFNAWKSQVENLYLTARRYYFATYRNEVSETVREEVRVTLHTCLVCANIDEVMKYMLPDDIALDEVVLSLIGGNEKKNAEIGQYMPAPKTVNSFRGAFERWLVRFVLNLEQWTPATFDEYNERIKQARKAQKEAKKAEYQSIIEKAKRYALDMGINDDEIEETVTKICKSTKVNSELARLLALWLVKKAEGTDYDAEGIRKAVQGK